MQIKNIYLHPGQFQPGCSQVPHSIPSQMPAFCCRSSNLHWTTTGAATRKEDPFELNLTFCFTLNTSKENYLHGFKAAQISLNKVCEIKSREFTVKHMVHIQYMPVTYRR